MTLDGRYRLADGVAIRTEGFGGLVYHSHKRQIYTIRSHDLTAFIGGLTGEESLADALEAFRTRRGLPCSTTEGMLTSLSTFERLGVLVRV